MHITTYPHLAGGVSHQPRSQASQGRCARYTLAELRVDGADRANTETAAACISNITERTQRGLILLCALFEKLPIIFKFTLFLVFAVSFWRYYFNYAIFSKTAPHSRCLGVL